MKTTTKLERTLCRYRVIEAHQKLVRDGHYGAARMILKLLRTGSIRLGLHDDAWIAENTLEDAGLQPHYGRNYYSVTFRI